MKPGAVFLLYFLVTLPCAAHAAGCGDYKPSPTRINIELELPEPFYDLKQGFKDVNKDRKTVSDSWIEKNGMQKLWQSENMFLLGYAEGAMAMQANSRIKVEKYDKFGVYYCPYVTDLNLSMIFRTRIVIPKEFPKGGCRFNMVNEHELRHYKVNRDVTEKFIRRLYSDLPVIIKEIEQRQPYVEGKDIYPTIKMMQQSVGDAIKAYIAESMQYEAARLNGQIDTPEEYASSAPKIKSCKN